MLKEVLVLVIVKCSKSGRSGKARNLKKKARTRRTRKDNNKLGRTRGRKRHKA